ncbi:hypothetical protein BT96DRAFT_1008588 [Gymnopus androsaceus JB14]|uniref:Uncharacterized protein n=1 Tax=Gymnopus androsaceus JB14 TaxID=1447944 RepID=A0A6A4GET6_9AGAR|nr:hypothetical protein BT96DRAFT_1008588 [Gymnopus androsaceus JB14]
MSRNPHKRARVDTRHETLPLGDDEDFYAITACKVQVRPGGQSYTVPVSPEKHKTNWSSRDAWLPEDPKDYGLDLTSELCDAAMNSDGVYYKPPAIKTPVVLAKTEATGVSSQLVAIATCGDWRHLVFTGVLSALGERYSVETVVFNATISNRYMLLR